MRNICFCLTAALLYFSINNVVAQNFSHPIWPDAGEPKTLINQESDLSVFAGIGSNYANTNDAAWVFIGAQVGVVVDKHFLLGIAGYGLASNVELIGIGSALVGSGKPLRVYGGYGGLITGARIAPSRLLHLNIPVLIGAGNIELVDENFFAGNNKDFTVERSACFVFEPSAELEVNVTNKFRISMGTGYRFVRGVNLVNFSDQQLTTMSSHFSLKFGWY